MLLVSAPAGFGKSTYVVEWLEHHGRPFAWYSLDAFDCDAGLFAEYLAAAVSTLVGRPCGLDVVPGEGAVDIRSMVSVLVEDLADAPAGAALVLDDYQVIDNPQIHGAVDYLIRTLPSTIGLVLITRADPPIRLGRLRADGRLVEVRGDALRFTPAEVRAFYDRTLDVRLSDREAEALAQRSEGWVAALQLVALAASQGSDLEAALSGARGHIAAYLVEEVLGELPPETSRFLLATGLLDRFDASLCTAVTDSQEAAEIIAELRRRNAFVVTLDEASGWYRYHHLFGELLRSRMHRTDPAGERKLLRRAARACDARGLADDSLDLALRADDLALAGDIVDRHAWPALAAGRVARLRSWLSRFPTPAGPAAGVVALYSAWCRLFEGESEEAIVLADLLESGHVARPGRDLRGELEVIRAIAAFQTFDPAGATRHAQAALECLPGDAAALRTLAHLYVGRSLYARSAWDAARPHLAQAATLAERENLFAAVTALFWLGAVETDTGDFPSAERSMKRAHRLAFAGEDSDLAPAGGIADVGLAFHRMIQLEPREAVRYAEHGTELLKRTTFAEMIFRAYFVWAEGLSLAGEHEASDAIASEGIDWLRGRSMGGGPLEAWLWLSQSRNATRRRRYDLAAAILDRIRSRGGLGGSADVETVGVFEAAANLSLALVRGDVDTSLKLHASFPQGVEGYVPFTIERWVLDAAILEVQGDGRSANRALERAIDLAHAGYRYQFSHVGPVVRPILERLVGRTAHDGFVRTLLERLPGTEDRRRGGAEALTNRELEILDEIAAGHSNAEIADRLFISRGTVKRHTANIYRKLHVHHRAEAIARGRGLGLIE